MRTPGALVVVLMLVLGVGACSGGPAPAEAEACDAIQAWTSGGHEPDRFDQFVRRAQDAVATSEHPALVRAVDELARSAGAGRAALAEGVLTLCTNLGWEPPEG